MAVMQEVPDPSSERRRARLRALADWHDEWTSTHLPAARFDPVRAREKTPSDYNLHYLDVHATPEQEEAFAVRAKEIMGIA